MPATEKPRAEPEIIPPGDLDGRPMRDRYHFDVHGGSQRIYVTRLGPFGIVVLGLLIALIAAVIPIVLLGALLIWIPVAVLFVVAAVVSGLLRGRDSVPPSPAEASASPPLAETTDAVRDERASQLVAVRRDARRGAELRGVLVARHEWDSGGPGAGAGVVDVYKFRGAFFASDDVGNYGPYEGFTEVAEAVALFH